MSSRWKATERQPGLKLDALMPLMPTVHVLAISSRHTFHTPFPTFHPSNHFQYVTEEHGEPQLKGEYTGMLELYNAAPHMVPKPYGWGRVASETCLFFYVCHFIPLTHAMPDPTKLAKLVAGSTRHPFPLTENLAFTSQLLTAGCPRKLVNGPIPGPLVLQYF
jgi:hypothetical protein